MNTWIHDTISWFVIFSSSPISHTTLAPEFGCQSHNNGWVYIPRCKKTCSRGKHNDINWIHVKNWTAYSDLKNKGYKSEKKKKKLQGRN